MEPEELPVALYDFLYKDIERIASYYAQVFSGRISLHEHSLATRGVKEDTAKVNMQVVAGDHKQSREYTESTKTIVDPHDQITTDILSYLSQNQRISKSIDDAPSGMLVHVVGTLLLQDASLLRLATHSFETMIEAEKKKPTRLRDQSLINGMSGVVEFFRNTELPSTFVLRLPNEKEVSGCLKTPFLSELVTTYYYRHGARGLANVHLIGIKEQPGSTEDGDSLNGIEMVAAMQQMASALHTMFAPPAAYSVTPIVMFRELA